MSKGSRAFSGGCQCGAIRFRAGRAPDDVYVCHCRMCQKSVGGPFAGYAVVPAADFVWTRGQPAEWASSSVGVRQFCGACGTPLGYRYFEGEQARRQFLTTGSFDELASQQPAVEVGVESKVDWVDRLRTLPRQDTRQAVGPEQFARIVNFQHPDHDTPEGWKPRPPQR